jgi:para-aminobenzoate synthetase component 1
LCAVEPHRFVHHLVSTVEATVDGATPAREVLRAMLPVGSVTGAPKLAAMAHIARFERERRGLYTGVYGVVTGARVRLAVAIRTLVRDAAGLHYGAGGGIVWDSDPDREWDELVWKQRAAER